MDAIPPEELITFKETFAESLRQVDPCFYFDQAWLTLQPVLNNEDGKTYSERKLEFVKLFDTEEVSTSPLIMGLHFLRMSSFERLATVIDAGIKNKNYFDFSATLSPRALMKSLNEGTWQDDALNWLNDNLSAEFVSSNFEDFFRNEAEVFRGGRHFRNAYKHGRMIQSANGFQGTPAGLKLLNEPNRKPFWFSFFSKAEGRSWYTIYRPEPMEDARAISLQAKTLDQIRVCFGHQITARIESNPTDFRIFFGAEFLSMSNWLDEETWLQSKFISSTTHITRPTSGIDGTK